MNKSAAILVAASLAACSKTSPPPAPSAASTIQAPPAATAAPSASAEVAAAQAAPSVSECPRGMVRIPAGAFMMGSNDRQLPDRRYWLNGSKDPEQRQWGALDEPIRREEVAAFCMDVLEVGVPEYLACVQAGACKPIVGEERYCPWSVPGAETKPISCVDHANAEAYCRFAGKRLPTEVEWEYAARGTDGRRYPWGDADPDDEDICITSSSSPLCARGSHPKDTSPFGVMDLSGNAKEWTSTPHTPERGTQLERVLRGRADSHLGAMRSASRDASQPSSTERTQGMRCAR